MEKRQEFVNSRLEEVFGRTDLEFFAVRPSSNWDDWAGEWEKLAERIFPAQWFMGEEIIAAIVSHGRRVTAVGGGSGVHALVGFFLLQHDVMIYTVYAPASAYLVVFPMSCEGRPFGKGHAVIGATEPLTAQSAVRTLLFNWDRQETRQYLLDRLAQAVEEVSQRAGDDYDEAVAVSEDGRKIVRCDTVVVVSANKEVRYPSSEFVGRKMIRPEQIGRIKDDNQSRAIPEAAALIRAGKATAVYAGSICKGDWAGYIVSSSLLPQ